MMMYQLYAHLQQSPTNKRQRVAKYGAESFFLGINVVLSKIVFSGLRFPTVQRSSVLKK